MKKIKIILSKLLVAFCIRSIEIIWGMKIKEILGTRKEKLSIFKFLERMENNGNK